MRSRACSARPQRSVSDPGFRSNKRLALEVAIPSATYDTDAKIAAFYDNLLERIGSLKGAQEAGAIS